MFDGTLQPGNPPSAWSPNDLWWTRHADEPFYLDITDRSDLGIDPDVVLTTPPDFSGLRARVGTAISQSMAASGENTVQVRIK